MMGGGANKPSLIEAQECFGETGVSEVRFAKHVRQPLPTDVRDPQWRPIDVDRDNLEVPRHGVDYGRTYPKDSTALYYWKDHYWRRV